MTKQAGLAVLAVDDEPPALDELLYLLRQCPEVGRSQPASTAAHALEQLKRDQFDVVLADIRMPGMDGLAMAGILAEVEPRPAVVFVTAHESYALDAFQVGALGYLLKPLDADRLSQVLARVSDARPDRQDERDGIESLAVEHLGTTTIIHRSEVEWVEAAGDYVRLHTRVDDTRHGWLVRIPIGLLEERWSPHGFARIHRGYLVYLGAIRELRTDGHQTVVGVAGHDLPVSRRQTSELRERLGRHVTRGQR